jgi:hypothetical protein
MRKGPLIINNSEIRLDEHLSGYDVPSFAWDRKNIYQELIISVRRLLSIIQLCSRETMFNLRRITEGV